MTQTYYSSSKLASEYGKYKSKEIDFIYLYFDRIYKNKFGYTTNILKLCLVGKAQKLIH